MEEYKDIRHIKDTGVKWTNKQKTTKVKRTKERRHICREWRQEGQADGFTTTKKVDFYVKSYEKI